MRPFLIILGMTALARFGNEICYWYGFSHVVTNIVVYCEIPVQAALLVSLWNEWQQALTEFVSTDDNQ